MIVKQVPEAEYALIGGSGTWTKEFPEEVGFKGVTVLQRDMEFETPFGTTVPLKLIEMSDDVTIDKKPRRILVAPYHGYHGLTPYNKPAEQIYWVFQQAGVHTVISNGSAAAVNPLLDQGDLVIPNDFFDFTKRPPNLHHFTPHVLRMRVPVCPDLSRLLYEQGRQEYSRVFSRGVYGNTDPPRFETAAEIRFLQQTGCDIVGQTMVPEVYLARAIGACYASVYLMSNYGEGSVNSSWTGDTIFDHYYDSAEKIGRIVLGALADYALPKKCNCSDNVVIIPRTIQERISEKQE